MRSDLASSAAYGGRGWSPRSSHLRDEIGRLWASCGLSSEWSPLQSVLLHRPGGEMDVPDPDGAQMLETLNLTRAQRQHDAIARAYRAAGVSVHYVQPEVSPPPNLMFVADLLFLTPEGAIVGRPASTVRAGEERFIARRLGELGIPILRTIRGTGVFEGADACWIDPATVLLATGLRTNAEGATQVASQLAEMGVHVVRVSLPRGTMHLMGVLRIADQDLAIGWPGRLPQEAVDALHARGLQVHLLPDETQAERRVALNFVTLGPRHILMAAGYRATQAFLEAAGITCETVRVDELAKAAGAIGCLTGILQRAPR